MKFASATALVASCLAASALAAPRLENRDGDKFDQGLPISKTGKGGPINGGTNHELDLQNPDNLGRQSTDNGVVPNLKWSFSDSKTRILKGGWVREQVVQDLPQSHDISGAQQHLKKGAIRELHWHRVAEWGFVYKGRITVSAVDEDGKYQAEELNYGDVWYFPKGVAHTVQGLEDDNEFLLVFDEGDFDKVGTTFNIDDWLAHTPKDILARNFGVPESVFDRLPSPNPYILNATVSEKNVTGAVTPVASGNSSFVYRTFQHTAEKVGGQGGELRKIDSTNFPISKTIAAALVTLKPGGLRELHWHPNAEEWLYFHRGTGRATAFIGSANARTFDFRAGDTAVFPDNAGHYIENTSKTEDLIWIEIYKSDRVADIPLTQWLALTPPDIVSQALKVPIEFVEKLKKEKQTFVE
ncbi:Bicupin, oxalate decarboxylase/oxidase [Metarhizium album ARSEF 1941]|uniref:Bicupin, oxalate decarboxylase/oxidase n=1 Tax=Metarhizium album (strain ARSEF 1941) TaxID=1081103 RepID=A0A0B2X7L5_METAS|nr:Bicupin, oxalate decarboxylase/oxidase [Metarhizium album ARSEF 1941]KHO01251.1 Bicupin, oxalate decarboxylase/oxidase [Metarhizium album ARSEF 1941]